MELIDHISDVHKIDDTSVVKALSILLRQVREAVKQDKLKGPEAAKEAMRRP